MKKKNLKCYVVIRSETAIVQRRLFGESVQFSREEWGPDGTIISIRFNVCLRKNLSRFLNEANQMYSSLGVVCLDDFRGRFSWPC